MTTSEAGQGGATEAALALINGVAGGEQETLGPQVREEETQRFIPELVSDDSPYINFFLTLRSYWQRTWHSSGLVMDILESTMLSSSMGQRPAEKLSQSVTWAWILCQVTHKARRKVVGLMFTIRKECHRQTELRPDLYSQTYEDKGIVLDQKGCSDAQYP